MELCVVISRELDGTYVAISPSFPKCISRGTSAKEALDVHRLNIRPHLAAGGDYMPDSLDFHVVENISTPAQPRT